MHDASDEDLLAALSTDTAAFEEFYRRHVRRVETIAIRRVGHPDQVADVVTAVFLTVIESAHRFDPRRGRAVPWLHGVAANVAAAERRRAVRDDQLSARVGGLRQLEADDYADLEARLDAEGASRHLFAALEELSDQDRRLLELISVDGLAPAEAAAVLGLRPPAVRMRLSRARRRLSSHMSRLSTPATVAGTPMEALS